MLWLVDPHETGNRNIDPDNRAHARPLDAYPTNNPKGVWRPVNVQELLTKVIVSPFAEPTTVAEAESELATAGCSVPVEPSKVRVLPGAPQVHNNRRGAGACRGGNGITPRPPVCARL